MPPESIPEMIGKICQSQLVPLQQTVDQVSQSYGEDTEYVVCRQIQADIWTRVCYVMTIGIE